MPKKVDFFLVGAPKCGTTALYEYLLRHPGVFMPEKERYFFGGDFTFLHPRPSIGHYQSLFGPAKPGQLLGEASVWYLYSKTAAAEIKAYNPNARIIIMLRNPAEMIYSLHSQQLYAGNENIQNFGEALAAQTDRSQGRRIPPRLGCPIEALQYEKVMRLGEQTTRYLQTFGSGQVMVIFFDDFVRHTAQVYRQTLEFLDLSSNIEPDFERVNPNKKIRSAFFRDLLRNQSKWFLGLGKLLLPSRKLRRRVRERLWQMNTRYVEREPMPPATRKRLLKSVEDDVGLLEQLLGKDLGHWRV